MSPLPLFRLCTAILCSLLSTETLRARPPAEERPATLRFLFLDETPGAYSVKTASGDYRQVSSTPYAISPPFAPSNLAPLEIYKTGVVADPATGRRPRVKVAVVRPPADTASALVVIGPATDDVSGQPAHTVRLFDNDTRSFPEKSIRILNLGHSVMAAQFGAERAIVEPGNVQIIQPSTDKYNRVVGKIAVSTPPDWNLLYNKVLIIPPGERLTGVFVHSPGGLRHTYTAMELAEMKNSPPPGHFWLSYSETL